MDEVLDERLVKQRDRIEDVFFFLKNECYDCHWKNKKKEKVKEKVLFH